MPSIRDYFLSLKTYLACRHVHATDDWIQGKIGPDVAGETTTPPNQDFIYRQWLEQDWTSESVKASSRPALPSELTLALLNREKKTFPGPYLLQISKIIDISKPLPTGNDILDDIGDDDDENEEENNEDFSQLFKKGKKPKSQQGKKPKKNFKNGPRMLQIILTDGHQECVAIEYQPIPKLDNTMIGVKVLIQGPLDCYLGTLLLRARNVDIVSDLKFLPHCGAEAQSAASEIDSNQNSHQQNDNIVGDDQQPHQQMENLLIEFQDDDDGFLDAF